MYLSDIDKPWACSGEDTGQLRIMYHNGGIMDNQGPNKYNYNNGNNGGNGGRNSGGNRNNRGGQGIMAFVITALLALFVYALISNHISNASTQEKTYTDFLEELDKGNVIVFEYIRQI